MWRRGALGVLVAVGVAQAEPAMRLGMTFGVDRNAPEAHEVGPLVGLGLRAGGFVGEVSYAYLSFFDPDTRIHRLGVALRGDVWHRVLPSGSGRALYAEVGAARRSGRWLVDGASHRYETEPQLEASVAFGLELGQFAQVQTAGWQIGLRLGVARRDPLLGTSCRGVGCALDMPQTSGVAGSAMLEWMFLVGE